MISNDFFKKDIQKDIIKSISYSQDEILGWIIKLYCPEGFELDPTYSKGNFYKNIKQPIYKYDIAPQNENIKQADCKKLPHTDNSITSIMFDPPFVGASIKNGKDGIIKSRFGYYKNIPLLWDMYYEALREFYRILRSNGVLVFKCQDTIENSKQYLSHIEIHNMAEKIGFYTKDIFILLAKNRIIGKTHHHQQHARKYHSYFLVFIKQESKVRYRYINIDKNTAGVN